MVGLGKHPGKQWIENHTGLSEFNFTNYRYQTELVLQGLDEISVRGPDLLLGKIFDENGFNQIDDELMSCLVLARYSILPINKGQLTIMPNTNTLMLMS